MEDHAGKQEGFEAAGGQHSELVSEYPHCVLPPNFFDLMLAKIARGESRERVKETKIIEIEIKPPFPEC